MTSIFAGTKELIKKDGTIDSHSLKQKVADNIEKQQAKREQARRNDEQIRNDIQVAAVHLYLMHKNLPKKKGFDFRIECYRHGEMDDYKVLFRVGGSGKRYSAKVGTADDVMPVLRAMRLEQLESGETEPLTSRALLDVERICRTYGY